MSGAHAIMHGEGRIPESEYRFFFVTNVAYLFGFVAHAIFLTVFSLLGIPEMVLHNVASCFVFFVAILANQRRRYRLAMSLAFSEVLVHAVLAVFFCRSQRFPVHVFVRSPYFLCDGCSGVGAFCDGACCLSGICVHFIFPAR